VKGEPQRAIQSLTSLAQTLTKADEHSDSIWRRPLGCKSSLVILLTALVFNTLGESLRVALDPTMKRKVCMPG
jgi:ABC-type dipeptide/oligopeptide/nickel transport system permease subunit